MNACKLTYIIWAEHESQCANAIVYENNKIRFTKKDKTRAIVSLYHSV